MCMVLTSKGDGDSASGFSDRHDWLFAVSLLVILATIQIGSIRVESHRAPGCPPAQCDIRLRLRHRRKSRESCKSLLFLSTLNSNSYCCLATDWGGLERHARHFPKGFPVALEDRCTL